MADKLEWHALENLHVYSQFLQYAFLSVHWLGHTLTMPDLQKWKVAYWVSGLKPKYQILCVNSNTHCHYVVSRTPCSGRNSDPDS